MCRSKSSGGVPQIVVPDLAIEVAEDPAIWDDSHRLLSPRVMGHARCTLAECVTPMSARSARVAAGRGGSGSGRLLAVAPRVVEASHLPPVPEQRAHRADRCDGHLPATMTTCAVDGDEKGRARHAVDRQGAGHRTLLQPSLFAENRLSREAESSRGGGKATGLSASQAATTTPCLALRFQTGSRTSGVDAHRVHALQGCECREKTHRLNCDPVELMATVLPRRPHDDGRGRPRMCMHNEEGHRSDVPIGDSREHGHYLRL